MTLQEMIQATLASGDSPLEWIDGVEIWRDDHHYKPDGLTLAARVFGPVGGLPVVMMRPTGCVEALNGSTAYRVIRHTTTAAELVGVLLDMADEIACEMGARGIGWSSIDVGSVDTWLREGKGAWLRGYDEGAEGRPELKSKEG